MSDQKNERDLTAELRAHRDDPDEWSEEAVAIEVRPSRSTVVSFRLPSEEFHALHGAAQRAGESLSEFIRSALSLRLHGETAPQALEVTSGVYRLQYNTGLLPAHRTENPAAFPDKPLKPLKYVL